MKLEFGQKSEQIRAVQLALGIEPSGWFDRRTYTAVLSWQMSRGLANTGYVDQAMWDELGCVEVTEQPKVQPRAAFKEDAKDGDGDGKVQDGTPFERPKSGK